VAADTALEDGSLHCIHAGFFSEALTRHPPKEHQMKLRTRLFLAALSLAALSPIQAADVKDTMKDRADARYDATTDAAKQNYEMAKENCKNMAGNARDVCMKEAEMEYVKAKSQARVEKKSATSQAEATDDQLKAGYKAAKENCDALSGNAKDACISEAKLKFRQ